MRTPKNSAAESISEVEGQGSPSRPGVPWLLAESRDDCWFFRQDVPGYASSHYTVTWRLEGTESVGQESALYWIDVAQRAVIAYGTKANSRPRVTSIVGFARSVRSFVQWACCSRLCDSLASIASDDIDAYEIYVASLGLTVSGAEQRLGALIGVSGVVDARGVGMGIRPYRWRGELRKAAKRIGRRNGRTRTLDPEKFFLLLDYSLSLIESSEAVVHDANAYDILRQSHDRPSRYTSALGKSAKDIISSARLTYGACIVLAFSLLGSRKHQLALLDIADLPSRTGAASDELVGRVTKTSNGVGGTETRQAAIPDLQRALDVVVSLTGIDLESGSGPLFRCLKLDQGLQAESGKALETNQVYTLISNVARAAGVEDSVRPHMFRRAFSMIYIWRYEFGDLHHLSRFLLHNGMKNTLAYAHGDDIAVFMGESQKALAMSVMERALGGSEPVGGGLALALRRLINRLRAQTSGLSEFLCVRRFSESAFVPLSAARG